MLSPVPVFDLSVEEAKERVGSDEAMYTWDRYSDERLLERARLVVEEALRAYAKIVETLLPKLRPHMPIATTLPGRVVGSLDPGRNGKRVGPSVRWYMEPLPLGSESTSEISLGARPEYREEYEGHASYLRPKIAALRPEAAGWLGPMIDQLHFDQLFDLTPVTKTARYWLWEDLNYAKWTDSMHPW